MPAGRSGTDARGAVVADGGRAPLAFEIAEDETIAGTFAPTGRENVFRGVGVPRACDGLDFGSMSDHIAEHVAAAESALTRAVHAEERTTFGRLADEIGTSRVARAQGARALSGGRLEV